MADPERPDWRGRGGRGRIGDRGSTLDGRAERLAPRNVAYHGSTAEKQGVAPKVQSDVSSLAEPIHSWLASEAHPNPIDSYVPGRDGLLPRQLAVSRITRVSGLVASIAAGQGRVGAAQGDGSTR
jgi:hypothetical protein